MQIRHGCSFGQLKNGGRCQKNNDFCEFYSFCHVSRGILTPDKLRLHVYDSFGHGRKARGHSPCGSAAATISCNTCRYGNDKIGKRKTSCTSIICVSSLMQSFAPACAGQVRSYDLSPPQPYSREWNINYQ